MFLLLKNEQASVNERTRLLYANSYSGVAITILAYSGLSYGLVHQISMVLPVILWSCMMVICGLRIVDTIKTSREMNTSHFDYYSGMRRFTVGLLSTSVIWAMFSLLFVNQMSLVELTICAMSLSAMAGGAITVLGPVRLIASVYMTLIMLPFCYMSFFLEEVSFRIVAILGTGYWIVMILAAKKASEFVSRTIHLTKVNEELVKEVKAEKLSLEKTNVDLSKANEKLDNYSVFLQDEVSKRTEEIYRLSNRDPLTQLLNRNALIKDMDATFNDAQRSNKRYAVIFIDLNGFKGINDSFGHSHGDEVLKAIAQRLKEAVTEELDALDYILGRWGGDEFILTLELTDEHQTTDFAELIERKIRQPIVIENDALQLSSSIGSAVFPDASQTPQELIKFADLAMYHTKKTETKLPLTYSADICNSYLHQQNLRKGLFNAIENGEFFLVYQPIIDNEQKCVYGVEVLLRWRYCGGLIPPDEFIPVAEKTGLINEIGLWVIERSLSEFSSLCGFEDYVLSINISAVQLAEPSFVGRVKTLLANTDVQPQNIYLELTESTDSQSHTHLVKAASDLSALGLNISIDDFGTGYSSLKQLQTVHFNTVKLDRSFVTQLKRKDTAIIMAALLISIEFGATTIVEGVETKEQLEILEALGLRYFQGFYYAKPMPIEALTDWLTSLFNPLGNAALSESKNRFRQG